MGRETTHDSRQGSAASSPGQTWLGGTRILERVTWRSTGGYAQEHRGVEGVGALLHLHHGAHARTGM